MKYKFHNHFKKSYNKLPKKLQNKVVEKLSIFAKNPFTSSLNNHLLIGKYKNYRNINITGDFRAVYKELSKNEIILVKLGTHSELYK